MEGPGGGSMLGVLGGFAVVGA
ncbi:MAG: hypothetical protein JWM61_2327, partial [Micrococcaceae bacterium]|nr:hypothetical protein [Micrococcaceae bacterium]